MTNSVHSASSAGKRDSTNTLDEWSSMLGRDIEHKAQASITKQVVGPFNYLVGKSEVDVGLAVGCVVIMGLLGFRMARVNKPDAQLLSPVIRMVGWCMQWGGLTVGIFAVLATALFVGAFAFIERLDVLTQYFSGHAQWAISGALAGLVLSLYPALIGIPMWERGTGLPDVEELVTRFKSCHGYDPRPFFNLGKGCFVGKDMSGEPIYVPWQKLRETHIQVLGTTGSGKGVLMSIVAIQVIAAGEALVWFDPKSDRFAPRLLCQAALDSKKTFILLDLNLGQPPQFSLFAGATEFEILDLFVAGMDLRGKGTDGDFHRGRDEDAAMVAARVAAKEDTRSISGLVAACAGIKEVTEAENFWRHLRKLSRLDVIDTDSGIDLAEVIAQGGVIYVRGSADTEVVKTLQKMVLARIAQVIKARHESDAHKPVCVILDELKHLLSMPAIVSLGVIRSFGAHFLLAHQSLGDLDGCANIPPVEVRGAVIDNTALKFVYRINDGEYAEWLSKSAGRKRVFVEATTKGVSDDTGHGGWREQHIQYLNPDLLTHLPLPSDRQGQASTGVLVGWGNAKLFYVGPMKATGAMPTPVVAQKADFNDGVEGPI